ncbi:hypothetical protein Rhopal_004412-T1 [Rhodotorula paludigena]|uniref:Uncharacterized protein n=1 Tax=Rhodotorula paludigena TaxID=86838 RepID=A0AAV5GPC1_9BASI|nr:hypothetical protein Rhopal_004412-T1 [Rhodotorula paludigena]
MAHQRTHELASNGHGGDEDKPTEVKKSYKERRADRNRAYRLRRRREKEERMTPAERTRMRYEEGLYRVERAEDIFKTRSIRPYQYLHDDQFYSSLGKNNHSEKLKDEVEALVRLHKAGKKVEVQPEHGPLTFMGPDNAVCVFRKRHLKTEKSQREFGQAITAVLQQPVKILLGKTQKNRGKQRPKLMTSKTGKLYARLLAKEFGKADEWWDPSIEVEPGRRSAFEGSSLHSGLWARMGNLINTTAETRHPWNARKIRRYHRYLQAKILPGLVVQLWNTDRNLCLRLFEAWHKMRCKHRKLYVLNRNIDLGPLHSTVATKFGGSHFPHIDCWDHPDALGAVVIGYGRYKGAYTLQGVAIPAQPGQTTWGNFRCLRHVSTPLFAHRKQRPMAVFFLDRGMVPKVKGETARLHVDPGTPLWHARDSAVSNLLYKESWTMSPLEVLARLNRMWEEGNGEDQVKGMWESVFEARGHML